MPTITDVARRAGVAVSTVSYALNGTRPISEETRRRIFRAVEELGYKPHALARGLASKRSRIIALLFPRSERGLGFTEFEFVSSAANAARANDYSLVLWSYDMHDLDELRKLAQQGLVEGMVVMEVHRHDERITMLRELGVPFSMIGRCDDAADLGYVDIDFQQTIRDAVDHLAGLGHQQIAFVNQSRGAFEAGYGPVVHTQAGFEDALAACGVAGVSRFCPSTPQAGYETFNALLNEHPELTAAITINERAVPGIMQAVYDRGWSIPGDFSVVSVVSSAPVAEMMIPALTALEPMTAELGRLGVELLIGELNGHAVSARQVLVPCQLVVRRSSGPCPEQTARPALDALAE